MKHKNFFIVPNQIFELGLKPKAFVVYCCLLRHSDSISATQQIDIYFRYIGQLTPKEVA